MISGKEGLIGKGANGEVRRGIYRGADVALKRLLMLRTDEAWVAEGGFVDLSRRDRQNLMENFEKECEMLRSLEHSNIVLFLGVVVGARALTSLQPSLHAYYVIVHYIVLQRHGIVFNKTRGRRALAHAVYACAQIARPVKSHDSLPCSTSAMAASKRSSTNIATLPSAATAGGFRCRHRSLCMLACSVPWHTWPRCESSTVT